MSEEQAQGQGQGEGAEVEAGFEEQLRELLAEDAYTIRPSAAPYPTIRRRGVVERRRRVAAAGAVLVTLAAVPVGAYAVGGSGGGSVTASPQSSVSASRASTPTPSPSPTPSGPAGPATPGQLLDGITFAQAADGLEKCLAYNRDREENGGGIKLNLGAADSYRIILAMNSTGDTNAPGDGMYVVAVRDKPQETRLICNVKDGEASGLNTSGGSDRLPDSPPVLADINGGKLYQQSFLDKGNWKLPFRWGFIGTVVPSVAKVTVSYGGATSEATLDHGWFVASGVLNQQVTVAPHIKGYDPDGKLIYDSDKDKTYQKTLP
ncbi:hypothetical protein [Streptomyces sp. NBC_01373]|uniref:hypothetical protein n=1 Tax=Streptomyces sp. NBC_01373 TaxID=2903843 RepID=UPI0022544AA5|nr:hypothetical protein [Streptomyces sp. NBC_01373]MCX4700882.1 hypothetical protein [Streptomyces sp. NBC_01373]